MAPKRKRHETPLLSAYRSWLDPVGHKPPGDLSDPDVENWDALGKNPRAHKLRSYTTPGPVTDDDPLVAFPDTSGPTGRLSHGYADAGTGESRKDVRARSRTPDRPFRVRATLPGGRKSSVESTPDRDQWERLQEEKEQARIKAESAAAQRRIDLERQRDERRRRPPSPTAVRFEPINRTGRAAHTDDDPEAWDLVQEVREQDSSPTYMLARVGDDPLADWEVDAGLEPYWYEIEDADRRLEELRAKAERDTLDAWRSLLCRRCKERPKVRSLAWCEDCYCQNPNHNDANLEAGKSRCKKSGPAFGLFLCSACGEYARTHKGDLRPVRLLSGRKTQ